MPASTQFQRQSICQAQNKIRIIEPTERPIMAQPVEALELVAMKIAARLVHVLRLLLELLAQLQQPF